MSSDYLTSAIIAVQCSNGSQNIHNCIALSGGCVIVKCQDEFISAITSNTFIIIADKLLCAPFVIIILLGCHLAYTAEATVHTCFGQLNGNNNNKFKHNK